jgi:peptidyl-prolyl cis-trans isomerase D
MLKLMRDSFHQLKWILLAVVAAFIIGFVFIDMGLGGARDRQEETRAYAARVNGDTISYRDFQRALYFTTENYKRMYGGQFTDEMAQAMGLNNSVMRTLIDQRLLMQQAERMHLSATQEEVRRRILSIDVINPGGKFVGPEVYQRWVQTLGFTSPAEFEDDLARQITIDKMESALTDSVVVSPKAAEAEYRRISESAKIRYVLYPSMRDAATVTVTPQEVEAYYKQNQTKYTHGEQRELRYLIADYAKLRSQIQPTEQQLRQAYNDQKESFKAPASAHALHILIKVDPGAPADVDAAAKAKAEGLLAQLKAGADWGALAKANSQDPGSAAKGGDMGWFDQGMMVPEFDDAVFNKAQIGEPIIVRSPQYGYHLIKVLERRPGGYRPFEQVRAQLAAQITDQMAKDQARDAIAKINAQIRDNKPKTADDFSKLANNVVVSNDTQWFGKTDTIPGLGYNNVLSAWTFQAKPGDIGDIIGTNRGPAIPFLENVRPAGISPLDEVRQRVEADAKADKAQDVARQKVAAAMLGAPSVDAVAAKLGLTAADTTVQRQGMTNGIQGDTSALADAAMGAQPGQVKGPVVAGNGVIAFQVLEQKKVTESDLAANRAAYVDQLRQQEARSLRQSLLQKLRKSAKIDVNDRLINQTKVNEGA